MTATSEPGTARVARYRAPSGNRDADYFYVRCDACGYDGLPLGVMYSNRTVEGHELAERDASRHRCPEPVGALTGEAGTVAPLPGLSTEARAAIADSLASAAQASGRPFQDDDLDAPVPYVPVDSPPHASSSQAGLATLIPSGGVRMHPKPASPDDSTPARVFGHNVVTIDPEGNPGGPRLDGVVSRQRALAELAELEPFMTGGYATVLVELREVAR